MFPFEYFTIITIISLHCIVISYCECSFQLFKDMDPRFQPVYFVKEAKKKSFALATQKLNDSRHYITIKESETLIITCPNKNGYDERYYEIDIFLVCGADKKLKVTKGADLIPPQKEVKEYACRYETGFYFKKESHKSAQKLCKSLGKGRHLYHIGLYANLEQKWLRKHTQEMFQMIMPRKITYMWFTLYSFCDTSLNVGRNIDYTYHTVNGEVIKNRQLKLTKFGDKDMRDPFAHWAAQRYMFGWFDKEYTWRTTDKQYKGTLNSYVNVENHHFVAVPLVPEDAMSFSSWRYATHLTPNIVPIWKQVSCTWKNLEKVIQLATIRIESTLDIYAGTFKKLVLATTAEEKAKGVGTTMDLDSLHTVFIPAIVWKLVYNKEENEAILFLFHNNPYRTARPDQKKSYCKSICKEFGWPVENEVVKLGETYCCDPRDFFDNNKEFNAYKKFFDIKNVLRLPLSKLIETDTD